MVCLFINPRPTHKVNSAGNAKFYTDWDNKFKKILNAPARVNSQSDATYRSKVVTAIEAKGESEYYKEWLQLPLDKLNISWIVPSSVVSNNESMIKKLKPKMQPLVRSFLINANESNHGLFISWGLRTNDDEKKFSDGVINGKHTKGLAVDVEFWDDVYKDVWPGDPMEFHWKICDYGIYDPNDPRWYEIGPIGQSSGLLWGNSFQDNPHFYLPE